MLRKHKFVRDWITPKRMIFFAAIFVFFIAYGNLAVLLKDILASVNKENFNGRTDIWYCAIIAILKKPFLGYGSVANTQMIRSILSHANHTHNIVLEFLFETGFAGAVLFLYYIKKNLKDYLSKNELLIIGMSVYIINAIFDFYITSIYFYLLILLLIWDQRVQRREKGRDHKAFDDLLEEQSKEITVPCKCM